MDVKVDTSNLEQMLKELSPRRRQRLLKNSIRSICAKTRRQVMAVVADSFSSPRRSPKTRSSSQQRRTKSAKRRDVARGVKGIVYTKSRIGFKICIYNGRNNASDFMHENRQGLKKPVLVFLERGSYKTGGRQTKGNSKRRAAYRGVLPPKHFMKKAAQKTDADVQKQFQEILIKQTQRIVEKYGGR